MSCSLMAKHNYMGSNPVTIVASNGRHIKQAPHPTSHIEFLQNLINPSGAYIINKYKESSMLFIAALTGSLLGGLIVSGSMVYAAIREQRKRDLDEEAAWQAFIDILESEEDKD